MASRDPQEAHSRRFLRAALGDGELPPGALDPGDAALALDRLPELVVDASHLGGGRYLVVAHAGEAEEIAGEFRAVRVEDERAAHSEGTAEKTGLEDHVVARRGLALLRRVGGGVALGRPVVLCEHERREIDLTREVDQPLQCRRPRIERSRPGLHIRNACRVHASVPGEASPAFPKSPGRCGAFPCLPPGRRNYRKTSRYGRDFLRPELSHTPLIASSERDKSMEASFRPGVRLWLAAFACALAALLVISPAARAGVN